MNKDTSHLRKIWASSLLIVFFLNPLHAAEPDLITHSNQNRKNTAVAVKKISKYLAGTTLIGIGIWLAIRSGSTSSNSNSPSPRFSDHSGKKADLVSPSQHTVLAIPQGESGGPKLMAGTSTQEQVFSRSTIFSVDPQPLHFANHPNATIPRVGDIIVHQNKGISAYITQVIKTLTTQHNENPATKECTVPWKSHELRKYEHNEGPLARDPKTTLLTTYFNTSDLMLNIQGQEVRATLTQKSWYHTQLFTCGYQYTHKLLLTCREKGLL